MSKSLSRILLAVACVACATPASADDIPHFRPGFYGNESVAVTDNAAGFLVNPAAGGFRYRNEFLLSWGRFENGSPSLPPDVSASSQNLMRAAFSAGGFGLAGTHLQDAETEIRMGLAGGDVMRIGTTINWLRSSGNRSRATDWSVGMLLRPGPPVSIGAVVDHLAQPRFMGSALNREYTLGLALRPLAFGRSLAYTSGPRFTVSADVRLREGAPNSAARVRVGGELEVLSGFGLRGSVEDHGRYQIGFFVRGVTSEYAGQTDYDDGDVRRAQNHTLSVHSGEEPTVLKSRFNERVAEVRVSGQLADERISGFGVLESGGGTPTWWVHHQLERALEDPLTVGVFLDVRGVAGMAQVEELRPRIRALRDAGKPVVAYLPYGAGRSGLYLASACDRIVTTPEAYYRSLGLRIEKRYYRDVLERWGLKLERTSYGKYKSAYREFSVDSTTDADRESIERILDVNQELFVADITRARGMTEEELAPIIDGRWWPAEVLQGAGLIDSIGYRTDALRIMGELTGLGRKPQTIHYAKIPRVRRAWSVPMRIAVVYASGGLELGEVGNDLVFGPYLGSSTLIRQLEGAFENPTVEAVVLRIESPGGNSLASNFIHRAITQLKERSGKPLIVSMGSVAASGGYHIATPADRIYADRYTYTGSIGTFFVKPSAEGLYRNWGVHQDDFERGEYMRGLSPSRDWDAAIQASADSATYRNYRHFVADVAAGRGMTWEEVDAVAQGRVWMGDDAVEHGLVDEIGTLEDAIAEARRRAGIPEGERIQLALYRRPRAAFLERYFRRLVGDTWRTNTHVPELGATYYWADVPNLEAVDEPPVPFLGGSRDDPPPVPETETHGP